MCSVMYLKPSIYCLSTVNIFLNFSEVLGAVLSILGIWSLTAILFYLAIDRLISNNFDIDANTMMIVSAIGVAINIV